MSWARPINYIFKQYILKNIWEFEKKPTKKNSAAMSGIHLPATAAAPADAIESLSEKLRETKAMLGKIAIPSDKMFRLMEAIWKRILASMQRDIHEIAGSAEAPPAATSDDDDANINELAGSLVSTAVSNLSELDRIRQRLREVKGFVDGDDRFSLDARLAVAEYIKTVDVVIEFHEESIGFLDAVMDDDGDSTSSGGGADDVDEDFQSLFEGLVGANQQQQQQQDGGQNNSSSSSISLVNHPVFGPPPNPELFFDADAAPHWDTVTLSSDEEEEQQQHPPPQPPPPLPPDTQ